MSSLNLKKNSALPISLQNGRVIFGKETTKPKVEIKSYKKYRNFFKDQKLDKDKKMYYIYRNSCLRKDESVFNKNGLRYDITVIQPGKIGQEPSRTIGHIHKSLPKIGRPSEIYQVIRGKAIFILHNLKTNTIYPIERTANQKIIISGNNAHITINADIKNPLVVANIFINKKNVSDYSFFKKTQGPAWYPIVSKNKIQFIKNQKSNSKTKLAPISKKYSFPKSIKINKKEPLYEEFLKNPKKFSFLNSAKKA